MFLPAGEHQWRPARGDNFQNIGNDLTITLYVVNERRVSVVNCELGRICGRMEGRVSRHRQVPKRRACSGITRAEIEPNRAALHEYDRMVTGLAGRDRKSVG